MAKLSDLFVKFFQHVKESEEGLSLLKEHNKIWQFDVFNGEPFYLEIKDGEFSVKEGWCDLDWRRKDWRKMNVVGVSEDGLRAILIGRMTPNEAMFQGKLALAARGFKTETGWLFMLLRVAKEQVQKKGSEAILNL